MTYGLTGGHIRPLLEVRTGESWPGHAAPHPGGASRAGAVRSPYVRDLPVPGGPAPGDLPSGFVVTAAAYRDSMTAAGVAEALDAFWFAAKLADSEARRRLCGRIADLVRAAGPSEAVVAAVGVAYPGLGIEDFGPVNVVVLPVAATWGTDGDRTRSVRGLPAVLYRIVECWAAHFTPDAVAEGSGIEAPGPEVVVRPARSQDA